MTQATHHSRHSQRAAERFQQNETVPTQSHQEPPYLLHMFQIFHHIILVCVSTRWIGISAVRWAPLIASSGPVYAFASFTPKKHRAPNLHSPSTISTANPLFIHPRGHDRSSSSSVLSSRTSKSEDLAKDLETEALILQQNQNHQAEDDTIITDTISSIEQNKAQRTLGILVLLSVPLSWGTYAPVVRYVYEMNPPIPGIVFSAGYYIVAAVSLIGLELWSNRGSRNSILAGHNETQMESSTTVKKFTDDPKYVPILGGMELGTYLFIGNLLQVIGLKTVPADRAAFLVQLTTIFVPLTQGIISGNLLSIPGRTWIACLVAFLGVVVMGLDGHSNNALDALLQPLKAMWGGDITTGQEPSILHLSQIFTGGDLLVVAAALAYTMHVLRLSSYVRKTTPLRLAGAKATVESLWSMALVFVLGSLKGSCSTGDSSSIPPSFICNLSQEITSYFATVQTALSSGLLTFDMWIPAVCACLWTGLVTCAYTIYAQSFGQRRVDATEANLIYSAQPLFSALFAWALLGEKLGSAGFLGGSLIALALWLVTTSTSASSTEETKKEAR